jgi:hypothetical protein
VHPVLLIETVIWFLPILIDLETDARHCSLLGVPLLTQDAQPQYLGTELRATWLLEIEGLYY